MIDAQDTEDKKENYNNCDAFSTRIPDFLKSGSIAVFHSNLNLATKRTGHWHMTLLARIQNFYLIFDLAFDPYSFIREVAYSGRALVAHALRFGYTEKDHKYFNMGASERGLPSLS